MIRGTRPRRNRIDVWCNDEEFAMIKATALASGLSISEYLRTLGKGYEPRSMFDCKTVDRLAQLYADQERLGGLLKLWLTNRRNEGAPVSSVRSVLQQIESLQAMIAKVVLQKARQL